jgi:hypothetical protein
MMIKWLSLGGAFLLMGLIFWLRTQLRYRITDKHLKVLLFGLPLRRVRLTNIEHVGKRRTGWGEHWWNTWRPFRRKLVIRRRRGLFKDFIITPPFRYEFKTELERAIESATGSKISDAADQTTELANNS